MRLTYIYSWRTFATMKLSDWRKREGLTQVQVAEKIGRTHPTVSRIEAGEHRPDWATLEAITALTGGEVTPNDFIDLPQDSAA